MDQNLLTIRQLAEEALSTGRAVEDVCADHPHLLVDVRELLERASSVAHEIDLLFPGADARGVRTNSQSRGAEPGTDDALPLIPGYEVQGILGFGGMGVVYKARHLSLNRTVAVKMPLAGAFSTASERRRHIREAKAIAAVEHPNIITVHDVGEIDGRPFFTMEFIDGKHLGERIANTPLPVRESAALVATLADAIHCGHLAGVTHRDLKPANVLLASDGAPKIADFGLAGNFERDPVLTGGDFRFGTPSYMSPEQARGGLDALGASVDIYALGAILYETLTGRPPFRSESPVETIRQVLEDEPVPPTRLNSKVPRDLETICLACLRKDKAQRYNSAAVLADDLRRFLDGVPIHARPVALPERAVKWVRRNPSLATAIGSVLILVGVVIAGTIWKASDSVARENSAEQDLEEAIRLQRVMDWESANTALDRAALRLGDGGSRGLRERLLQARRDSELALRLEDIRLQHADSASGYYLHDALDRGFAEQFRSAGLLVSADEPSDLVASRIRAKPIAPALIDAVDLWSAVATDERLRVLLRETAEKVEPSELRRRLYDHPIADQESLNRLMDSIDLTNHRPMLFIAFTWRLNSAELNIVPLLTAVQRTHPTDLWANLTLGDELAESNPNESVRYYQAALALRPSASVIHNNLAIALAKAGRNEDAKRAYELALAQDPQNEIIRVNLAGALVDLGQNEEALALARSVPDADEKEPRAFLVIAEALFNLGRVDESIAMLQTAMKHPSIAEDARLFHRSFLARAGRLEEVRSAWAQSLLFQPADHDQWDGYAELCLYLGDTAAYQEACERLLERFAQDLDPGVCERTGRACLLGPSSPDLIARAAAAVDRAMSWERARSTPTWRLPYYRVASALAAYRLGEPSRAVTLLNASNPEALGPLPLLIRALAQDQLGHRDRARDALSEAIAKGDWNSPPDSREKWMNHILRREVEEKLLQAPPAPEPPRG